MRIHGSAGVAPIECINPRKNKWRVRWDIEEKDGAASYEEAEFDHRPQMDEVLEVLRNWYNAKTEGLIRTGFVWEKIPVWLSVENQVNYKAAFDLAVQTEGANLPVVFKFGTDEKPVYRTFATTDDLRDFYTAMVSYIQTTLEAGWKEKEAIDVGKYNVGLEV